MADQSTEAREAIARIVDPTAWEMLDAGANTELLGITTDKSLAKADAILALSLPVQDTSDELTRLRAEVEAKDKALAEIIRKDRHREWTATTDNPEAHWVERDGPYAAIARTTLNGEQANGG